MCAPREGSSVLSRALRNYRSRKTFQVLRRPSAARATIMEADRTTRKAMLAGRAVPQLYSKLAASQELRRMLVIGKSDDLQGVYRMSDCR